MSKHVLNDRAIEFKKIAFKVKKFTQVFLTKIYVIGQVRQKQTLNTNSKKHH